jgi:hypothetical protein
MRVGMGCVHSGGVSSYPERAVSRLARAKRQGLGALAVALALVAALAASALAFITVYNNSFGSKSAYKEIVRVGHGSKACDRSWNAKREIMRIELGRAPAACTYKPPVQGDGPQPDHRFDVGGRILKNTADNIRDDAYLSIAIRVGGGKRYELRVFPKGKEFQLRRQPSGGGFPDNGSNPAIGKIGKLNQLRLRADGSQITASVNGTQVASVNDGNPSELSGAKLEFGVGSVGNSKKDTLATFDKVKVAVPDP